LDFFIILNVKKLIELFARSTGDRFIKSVSAQAIPALTVQRSPFECRQPHRDVLSVSISALSCQGVLGYVSLTSERRCRSSTFDDGLLALD
jgi:hypothetical protein